MYQEDVQLNPEDEALVVRKLQTEASEGNMCSINASWWDQWVRYTGYEWTEQEAGPRQERPGPIGRVLSLSSESSSSPRKMITQEIWDQLHAWYGSDNGQLMDREVEEEVYYVKVYLLNSGRRPFTSQFRSQVAIREVFNKACRFFSVSPEKRFLYDPENRREIPVDENLEVGDADFEDETKLCILSKASPLDSSTINSVGRVGLDNQGNTCYMNSALQVLLHCPEIMDYFLTDMYKEHISQNNPDGSGGRIVEAFADLTKKIWKVGSLRSTRPSRFWDVFSHQHGQFASKSQHDTAEFAESVLDSLMEDCNRSEIPKVFQEMDDDASKSDKEVGDENWDYHMARSNSYITDKFHGQFRAVTTCPSCNYSSRKFQSFTVLQLGLPHPKACEVNFVLIDVGGNSAPKKMKVVAGGKGSVQDVLYEVAESIRMKDPNPTDLLALGQKKAEGEVVMKGLDDKLADLLGFGPLVVYQYPCPELGPQSGGRETHFIHQKQSFYASQYTWSSSTSRDRQKFGFPLVVWIPELSGFEGPKCRSLRKRPHEILEEIFEASMRPAKRHKEEANCLIPCPETESGVTGEESIEMEEISAALPALEANRSDGDYPAAGNCDQAFRTSDVPFQSEADPSDSMDKSPTTAKELDSEDNCGVLAVSTCLLQPDGYEDRSAHEPKPEGNNENSPDWTCEAENGRTVQPASSEENSPVQQPASPALPPEQDKDTSSDQDQLVSCCASELPEDVSCALNAHHEETCEAPTREVNEIPNGVVKSVDLQRPNNLNSTETKLAPVDTIHGQSGCTFESCVQSNDRTDLRTCGANLCGGMAEFCAAQTRLPDTGAEAYRTAETANGCNGLASGDSEIIASDSARNEQPNVLLLTMGPGVSCSTADAGAGDDADSVAAQGNGSGSDFELGLSSLIADEEPVEYGPVQNDYLPHFSGSQGGKIISSCQSGSYDLMEVDEPTPYSSYTNSSSRKIIVDWKSAGENNYDLEMLQESVADYQMSQSDQVHTILECFEHEFSPHPLDEDNLWKCGRCKKKVEGVKSMRLWKTPDVLVVSLKRFNFSGHRSIKLMPKVHFPLKGLDLSEFCESQESRDSMLYDLCGVCYHHGSSLKSGHYTSVAKMPSGRWCEFNDSSVSGISTDHDIVASSAYLLCYRRQGADMKSAEDILKEKWLSDYLEQKRKADLHFDKDTLTDCEDNSEEHRAMYNSFESSHGGYGRFSDWNSLADNYGHRGWDLSTSTGLIDTTCNPLVSTWDHTENYSSTLSSYPGHQPDIDSNGSGQLYLRPRHEYQPAPESSRDNSPERFA